MQFLCNQLTNYSFENNGGYISDQGWSEFCSDLEEICFYTEISEVSMSGQCVILDERFLATTNSISFVGKFQIPSGEFVIFDAEQSVKLDSGFQVDQGAIFERWMDVRIRFIKFAFYS